MGLPGKHPADLCQNKGTLNCHNCGGCAVAHSDNTQSASDPELIASITKKVMEQLGIK